MARKKYTLRFLVIGGEATRCFPHKETLLLLLSLFNSIQFFNNTSHHDTIWICQGCQCRPCHNGTNVATETIASQRSTYQKKQKKKQSIDSLFVESTLLESPRSQHDRQSTRVSRVLCQTRHGRSSFF